MSRIEESNACLAAYERVLKIYELGLADYFKRTQILMVVIQSVLLLAFGKLVQISLIDPPEGLSDNGNEWASFVLLVSLELLPAIGAISAWTWREFIRRRKYYVDCYRWYLRDLEYRLVELGIPLDYFSVEKKIFRTERKFPHFGRWSGEIFPGPDGKNRMPEPKGGLMKMDQGIPVALFVLWLACFSFVFVSLIASCHVKVLLIANIQRSRSMTISIWVFWVLLLGLIIFFLCRWRTKYFDNHFCKLGSTWIRGVAKKLLDKGKT